MILLSRYKYVLLILSFLLCSQIWANVIFSEDRISFMSDDVDPPITWYLDYSLSEDKLCQIRGYDSFPDSQRCTYKNKQSVSIKSVIVISLTIDKNLTHHNPEETAFIVYLCSTNGIGLNDMAPLFVFKNKDQVVSGVSPLLTFKMPYGFRERRILNYSYIYEGLKSSEASNKLLKSEKEIDKLKLCTYKKYTSVFCGQNHCLNFNSGHTAEECEVPISVELCDIKITFTASYKELNKYIIPF